VFWSLVIVISIKYLALVMRADSDGEGGILTLTALVIPTARRGARWALVLLGLFRTALLYGEHGPGHGGGFRVRALLPPVDA
jgi:KUP system potassium uptake protein